MSEPLLELRGITHEYRQRRGLLGRGGVAVTAVDGVTLSIDQGQTVALVGESGSGKSTLGRCAVRLLHPTSGQVIFRGEPVGDLGERRFRPLRRELQIVFQNPYATLNPRRRIGQLISDPLRIHHQGNEQWRHERARELLDLVGLDPECAGRWPHEFSGGQLQRVGIARAMALDPQLIVADEPVSALDVSIQAQIVNLLRDLQRDRGVAYLFISHNLGVVRHIADRVAVMYLGRIVEECDTGTFFSAAQHPYSALLLSAVPGHRHRSTASVQPETPPLHSRVGCRFRNRCPRVSQVCHTDDPPLASVGQGQRVACHHPISTERDVS